MDTDVKEHGQNGAKTMKLALSEPDKDTAKWKELKDSVDELVPVVIKSVYSDQNMADKDFKVESISKFNYDRRTWYIIELKTSKTLI